MEVNNGSYLTLRLSLQNKTLLKFLFCPFNQLNWSTAAIVAQSSSTFKPNQPVSHSHRPSSHNLSFLLPLPYLKSSSRCVRLVAHLCYLRNLVRALMDSGPVPQMVPYNSRNLPWSLVNKVWTWRRAKSIGPSWCPYQYSGQFQGITNRYSKYGSFDLVCWLSCWEG